MGFNNHEIRKKSSIITGAEASIGETTAKLFDQEGARQYNLIKFMK